MQNAEKLSIIKANPKVLSLVNETISECRRYDRLRRELFSSKPGTFGSRTHEAGYLKLAVKSTFTEKKGNIVLAGPHSTNYMFRWHWSLSKQIRISWLRKRKQQLLISWEQLTGSWRYETGADYEVRTVSNNIFEIEAARDILESANDELQVILDEKQEKSAEARRAYAEKVESIGELL